MLQTIEGMLCNCRFSATAKINVDVSGRGKFRGNLLLTVHSMVFKPRMLN